MKNQIPMYNVGIITLTRNIKIKNLFAMFNNGIVCCVLKN